MALTLRLEQQEDLCSPWERVNRETIEGAGGEGKMDQWLLREVGTMDVGPILMLFHKLRQ